MAHFDERSGIIPCLTSWGQWHQTMEDVFIECTIPEGTSAKMIKINFEPKHLSCFVGGREMIKGELFAGVISEDCTWTLEDRKLIRIILVKSQRTADNCWRGLMKDQYIADAYVYDQMEKKLTLQKFQHENPGFDFSGAEISGNYSGGGPTFNP